MPGYHRLLLRVLSFATEPIGDFGLICEVDIGFGLDGRLDAALLVPRADLEVLSGRRIDVLRAVFEVDDRIFCAATARSCTVRRETTMSSCIRNGL